MKRIAHYLSEASNYELKLGNNEELHLFFIGIGEISGNITLSFTLGEYSHLIVENIILLTSKSDVNISYSAVHDGRESVSAFHQISCLKHHAKKDTRMNIIFNTGCVGANGSESEECYLLSSTAKNHSCPALYCYEDDVSGKHNMSTGHFDAEQMSYLEARGISYQEAQNMMINAKIQNIINNMKIPDQNKVKRILKENGF